jgi:hypothetical protein
MTGSGNRRYSPRTHALAGKDPLPAIDAPPVMVLCINKQWIPFFTGVLEVLTAPHYWEDPDTMVPQVEALIAELGKTNDGPCGPAYGEPNWYLEAAGEGELGFDWRMYFAEEFNFSYVHFYFGHANFVVSAGVSRITLTGLTADGADPAGGKIRWFGLILTENTIAPVGTFQWRDCLGVLHIETLFASDYFKENFEAKEIVVTHSEDFTFGIVIEGDYLCSVA